MTESFAVSALVGFFRESLIALLPIMDRSRIEWRDGKTYDPWEDIERTLYHSIIGSCAANIISHDNSSGLAPYGLSQPSYANKRFLVASDNRNAAFLELVANTEPFSDAVFLKLGADLVPTGERVQKPLHGVQFLLATPNDKLHVELSQRITYKV